MKIWIIGRGYPTIYNKMLGSFELQQAKMLAKAGNDVTYPVVKLIPMKRAHDSGIKIFIEENVKITMLSVPVVGRICRGRIRTSVYWKAFTSLERILIKKSGFPDIIHVHYPSMVNFSIIKPLRKGETKIVSTEHWSEVQKQTLEPIYVRNLTDFLENGDAFCCVGSGLKQSIEDLTKTKKEIQIVPNVLSSVFHPVNSKHKEFRFISIGRLVAIKQFDTVVQTFINTFHEENVTFTLVGSGEEFDKIKKIIMVHHAQDRVLMVGELTHEQMAELLANSDALVSFSLLETFCVPVIEAWACGVPVIASSTTAVFSDNPDPRLGMMVNPDDTTGLGKAMRSVYDNIRTYDPEWLHSYAETRFSEKVVTDKLLSIYNQL